MTYQFQFVTFLIVAVTLGLVNGGQAGSSCYNNDLPSYQQLIEKAFPVWVKNSDGETVKGKWNPNYFTKRYDGLDAASGGYPTAIDTRYVFEYASPFHGQPGGGSPHHCPINAPNDYQIQACPKVTTSADEDPIWGPGHIPAFVTLSAVKREFIRNMEQCSMETILSWFDYDLFRCDIIPSKLLEIVRYYYPREKDGSVHYPSPFIEGQPEYYPFEYLSTGSSPHFCSSEYEDEHHWADWCPYSHEGLNAGKFRPPHLALASIVQYIANQVMPDKCDPEWDEGPQGYPLFPDSSMDWVVMNEFINGDPKAQPLLPYTWPESGSERGTVKTVKSVAMARKLYSVPLEEQRSKKLGILMLFGICFALAIAFLFQIRHKRRGTRSDILPEMIDYQTPWHIRGRPSAEVI